MNLAEYKHLFQDRDDAAPGWDAINSRLAEIYGSQEPKHWGTSIPHMLGGPDPIDGISAYECRDGGRNHLHFCTYGYSSLYYDEDAVGGEFSGYGFEMTFRLASPLPPVDELTWACGLLQNLARYVFKTGKHFAEGHWIPANGPIRAGHATSIVGLAFLNDPTLPAINTPHGRVEFVQAFGITQKEIDDLMERKRTCSEIIEFHQTSNPFLITDLARQD